MVEDTSKKKNSAAVALGRKGGKKRAELLSPEDRAAQARKAATARWGAAETKKPAKKKAPAKKGKK